MNNFIDDRVQEVTIVRDQNQRAGVAFQPFFQPDDRIEIEVVSRFIEQQQIGTTNQRLREVQAHTPTAGKVADRAFKLLITEPQPVQQAGGARTDGPGINGIQFTVHRCDGVAVIALVGQV